MTILTISLILFGYLLGSVSSAVIMCRLFSLPDPRTEGSKNPGATNVLRLGGKKEALLTLLCDVLKGLIPVVVARILLHNYFFISCVGFAAYLGHLYPIFFGFKGGKGIATAFGFLLGISPIVALLVLVTWILVALVFRFSSLASLVAAILAPVYALLFSKIDFIPVLLAIVCLIILRHKDNIKRLTIGDETKIDLKRKKTNE